MMTDLQVAEKKDEVKQVNCGIWDARGKERVKLLHYIDLLFENMARQKKNCPEFFLSCTDVHF